jgi:hypothetical protein
MIKAQSLGLCPCGKEIFAAKQLGAVIHARPECQKFIEMEPDEFLSYVRASRGLPDPDPEKAA